MKHTNRVKAIISVGALLLIIALFGGCSFGKNIDLNKYVVVSFSGSDGKGTASCTFNTEQFVKDHSKDLPGVENDLSENQAINDAIGNALGEILGDSATKQTGKTVYVLKDKVTMSVDKTNMLSNGDTITITWQCDDQAIEQAYGVRFAYSDMKVTVNNLNAK